MGLTRLVVGLTIVSFGTSSPELVVSLKASLDGNGIIALGNVIGSNICDSTLILGLSAVLRPLSVDLSVIRMQLPIVIVVTLGLTLMLLDGVLGRFDGILLTMGLGAYTVFNVRFAKKGGFHSSPKFEVPAPTPQSRSPWVDAAFCAGGFVLLAAGGHFFVVGVVDPTGRLGICQSIIALTIVAVGTGLPELATSLVASMRGEADISVGNVVGSNVLNILGILGIAALIHPMTVREFGVAELVLLNFSAVLILPLARTGFLFKRWEGRLLLGLYSGYVGYLAAK